jgi:hydrogenase maturation factor HypE
MKYKTGELPDAFKTYHTIVKEVKENIIKSGIQVNEMTSISKYVGDYYKMAKVAEVEDFKEFIMEKYEEDKKQGIVKQKLENITTTIAAKKQKALFRQRELKN